ncbi:hypothetical protein PAPHI01_0732 [Pancytospora philotis]|nr:hypothetical protein PAPHI01_0732 [Pancytospora philotis]
MEIQNFKKISASVYKNIQALSPSDIETLRGILKLQSISYGRIRTFSLEDSQTIVLLTLKQNCLILIKFLLENEIEMPKDLLDDVIELLFLRNLSAQTADGAGARPRNIDLQAQIEKEQIETQIFNAIVDIVYRSEYYNTKLKDFLMNKTVPDDASVNFAPLIEGEYHSFELLVLSKLMVGPVLLNLVSSYRSKLRGVVKQWIVRKITPQLDSNDYGLVYQIFQLINERPNNGLLRARKFEDTAVYLGFAASLIHDKESADIAHEKLLHFYDDLEYAFSVLASAPRSEERRIQPKDEEMLEMALACIVKLVRFKSISFYKFLGSFQAALKLKLSSCIKGAIYEILLAYIPDRDVLIEKTVDCKEEVQQELKSGSLYLLPRVIRFINAYRLREEADGTLSALSADESSGVGRLRASNGAAPSYKPAVHDDFVEYKILGLRSEDPATVAECLGGPLPHEILKLNAQHIRNAILLDASVADRLVAYQIENKVVLEDVSIIHLISSMPSEHFFEYAKLFSDFSMYLNGDVLERIGDDLESGAEWLHSTYSREIGLFVLRNSSYFNELLANNRAIQPSLLRIYEKVLLENIESAQVRVADPKNSAGEAAGVFLVYDSDEDVSTEFFRIFANQILYAKFCTGRDPSLFLLKRQYAHPGFTIYLKAKMVAGFDVVADIKFLKSNLMDADELLGFLRIVSDDPSVVADLAADAGKPSPNIMLNFGVKNSEYFLKHFGAASEFEKFVLFFSVDEASLEVETIIKDEVMRCMRQPNKLYLDMCVLQLFKCKNLDNILKMLEKHYDNKELLFKLNIYNILNGGHYCSKHLITHVDSKLMCKALLILSYLNIWDREYLTELVSKVEHSIPEDSKYLIADIRKY